MLVKYTSLGILAQPEATKFSYMALTIQKMRSRVPGGQSSLMYTIALVTANPLASLMETHVARYIPHKEYPTVYSKQSG